MTLQTDVTVGSKPQVHTPCAAGFPQPRDVEAAIADFTLSYLQNDMTVQEYSLECAEQG